MSDPIVFWVVVAVVGLIVLYVGFLVLAAIFYGALMLFGFAAEQGFIGMAVYFACWFFLLPVMLVASFVAGVFIMINNRGGAD